MKIKLFFSLFISVIVTSFSAYSQTSGFNGEWIIDKNKSILTTAEVLLVKINITLRNDSLLTFRVYEHRDAGEYSFEEKLRLNDKGIEILVFGMSLTSKAKLSATDGSLIAESIFMYNDGSNQENTLTVETWKVDKGGGSLIMNFTSENSEGEIKGTNYYCKVQ